MYPKTYPIARKEHANLAKFLPKDCRRSDVRAMKSGERRPPFKGEWYLAGEEAYLASEDFHFLSYYILRLVKVRKVTEYELVARLT